MPTSTLTPNMNLIVPTPGEELSPTWAVDLNNDLGLIDSHDHSSGFGVPITPDGLDINSDLPFNNTNNITNIRSVRFFSNGSPIAGVSDLGCLYESGVDLYYNDGAGNQIRITQSGSVAGASGTITGLPSGTASAAYSSGSGTFVFDQSTSTAANLDVASIAIRYPGSYPTPSGNYVQLQAPSTLASGYSFTLPNNTPAASGAFFASNTSGVLSYVNADNSTLEIATATLQVKDLGITNAKIAANTINAGAKIEDGSVDTQSLAADVSLPGTHAKVGSKVIISAMGVTSGGKQLLVIRGSVTATGTAFAGEGYTVSRLSNPGYYRIVSDSSFGGDGGICVVTPAASTGTTNLIIPSVNATSSLNFDVFMKDVNGVTSNTAFNFIIMGERA